MPDPRRNSSLGTLIGESLEKWVCCVAIAFGVFLRVYCFWAPSLWLDEIATAHAASAPDWATLLERCRLGYEPPVHHVVARFFLLFGRNEFFLRLPTVLFGLASIAVLMLCVRRVAGARGALYAGAIFALNSRAIIHTQDARMYGLALFLSAMSIYAFLRLIEGSPRWWLLVYAAVTVLLIYDHIIYGSVLIGQVIVAAGLSISSRERLRNLRPLFLAQGLILVLVAPLAPLFLSAGTSRATLYSWIDRPNLEWFRDFFEWPECSFALVMAPGLLSLWMRRQKLRFRGRGEAMLFWLGIVYAAIWPAAVTLSLLGVANILMPRYLLPALVGVLMVLGLCAGKSREPMLRFGLCAYIAFVAFFQGMVAVKFGPWVGILPRQDWRAASQWIQERYRPGDVVLLKSGLAPVKTLPPTRPGAQEFLSAALTGFYNRRPMTVFNLPWTASELPLNPYTPQPVQELTRRAGQVFVLVNPLRDRWGWEQLDEWISLPGQPAQQVEKRRFQGLELRLYSRGAAP